MANQEQAAQEQTKALFMSMVSMLTMSALQELGKMPNPATGKTEIRLENAQMTIDLLDMLSIKTKGNLDNDEAKAVQDSLTMLKLNYVETKKDFKADKQPADTAKPKAETSVPEEAPPPEPDQDQPPATDEDKVKFRKSYG